jgi:uncharacterized protein YbjT (DUF2867 family)
VVDDDLLDPTYLGSVLEGVDVVLIAVGSGVTEVFSSGLLVDGAGNVALLEAAVDAGVDALVMESAVGVGDEPASAMATAFDLFIGPVQRAKADAETAIRESPVRHTILRPGALTGGAPTDDVTVAEPGAKLWGVVPRTDVARLMTLAPATPAAADRTFEVVATPSFRDRGLGVDWWVPGRGSL